MRGRGRGGRKEEGGGRKDEVVKMRLLNCQNV